MKTIFTVLIAILISSCNQGATRAPRKGKSSSNSALISLRGGNLIAPSFACVCNTVNGDVVSESGPSCDDFCSNVQLGSSARLYINFPMPAELSSRFTTIDEWCNKIEAGDINPSCNLIAVDNVGFGQSLFQSIFFSNNTLVAADVTQLSYNTPIRLSLLQTMNGDQTQEITLERVHSGNFDPNSPPTLSESNLYSCVYRARNPGDPNDSTIYASNEKIFMHPDTASISIVNQTQAHGFQSIACHNDAVYPSIDNESYPRLGLVAGPRLFHANDPKLDATFVNNFIINAVQALQFNFSPGNDLFFNIALPHHPQAINPMVTGKVLRFFQNNQQQFFCPNSNHYSQFNSNPTAENALLKVMGDFLGQMNTQPLYLARHQIPTAMIAIPGQTNSIPFSIPDSLITITHQLLGQIALFRNPLGQLVRANESDFSSKAIKFYWPPNPQNPFENVVTETNKPKKLFDVICLGEIDPSGQGSCQNPVAPPNKMIGCVPVVL